MIVTVDTNVLFAALNSRSGASYAILRLVIQEKLRLAVSVNTYFEYSDVLLRRSTLEEVPLTEGEIEDFLDLLALLAKKHAIYYLLRPNLTDENDNMFVECAFASQSDYLITSNIRDFKAGQLKGFPFEVITPGEFIKRWRKSHE